MTDKTLVKQRFSRAAQTYDTQAVAQHRIARTLAQTLAVFDPKTEGRILEIGCGTGFLTTELRRLLNPRFLAVNDLCPQMLSRLPDVKADLEIAGDAETVSFPSGLDLIASCSTVQWLENLPRFFDKCADSLSGGGLLAVSTFGERNMQEIARLTSSALRYYSAEELSAMLAERFEVLHHLKDTGVTGTTVRVWTRSSLAEFDRRYRTEFPCEGGVRLTYEPIYFIARKK